MSSHPIEDLSFDGGWLCCLCGELIEAETPDELAASYRAHRAQKGAETVVLSQSKNNRGAPFTIKAKHQQREVRQDDPVVGYLLEARPT